MFIHGLFCFCFAESGFFGAGEGDHVDGSVVPPGDSTYIMTKEHAAAFKKVPNEPESYSAALLCHSVRVSRQRLFLRAAGAGSLHFDTPSTLPSIVVCDLCGV